VTAGGTDQPIAAATTTTTISSFPCTAAANNRSSSRSLTAACKTRARNRPQNTSLRASHAASRCDTPSSASNSAPASLRDPPVPFQLQFGRLRPPFHGGFHRDASVARRPGFPAARPCALLIRFKVGFAVGLSSVMRDLRMVMSWFLSSEFNFELHWRFNSSSFLSSLLKEDALFGDDASIY
jgi:hypothetical protein